MVDKEINVKGLGILIWEDYDLFLASFLDKLGFLVVNEIQAEIKKMKLIDTGEFLGSINHKVEGDSIVIFSNAPHAPYIEYGTFTYFDIYGKDTFPNKTPPKKKDVSFEFAKLLPKGVPTFAPFRKVIYNDKLLKILMEKALVSSTT